MSKLDQIKFGVPDISPVHGDSYIRQVSLTAEAKQQIKALMLEVIYEATNIPDTNCAADHVHADDHCEPKDHWRRDGRFFAVMEITERAEALVEAL